MSALYGTLKTRGAELDCRPSPSAAGADARPPSWLQAVPSSPVPASQPSPQARSLPRDQAPLHWDEGLCVQVWESVLDRASGCWLERDSLGGGKKHPRAGGSGSATALSLRLSGFVRALGYDGPRSDFIVQSSVHFSVVLSFPVCSSLMGSPGKIRVLGFP